MQVTNSEIADIFKFFGNLLELHGENEFKSRSYHTASFRIDKLPMQLFSLSVDERQSIEGIGKGIFSKIEEILNTGHLNELEKLVDLTPVGVIQMMRIKGIGPKKVRQIWKQLEVESVGELLYACNENRLVGLSGFGVKTQQQIIRSIEFLQSNADKLHFNEAESIASEIIISFQKNGWKAEMVGELSRKCEIINLLEIIVGSNELNWNFIHGILAGFNFTPASGDSETQRFTSSSCTLPMVIHFALPEDWSVLKFKLQSTSEFLEAVQFTDLSFSTEDSFFLNRSLPFIIPEMRENKESLEWARLISDPSRIVSFSDLKGCIHNHSNWSDGANSIAEMAEACQDLGLQYFVISDHSKTAFYANGLSVERVNQQQKEIDLLNTKWQNFKVFKSIESDILGDGSLDYDAEVLQTFDLVIASVHSNLKMDEERATKRILTAIENPYTRILGHPTGRLLLSRPGYPIDHRKIIDACASNKVAIELNAHPYRLDLDWRWISYAQNKGILISINPDAHEIAGIRHMQYGINVARKAGLLAENTLNTFSLEKFENWVRKGK